MTEPTLEELAEEGRNLVRCRQAIPCGPEATDEDYAEIARFSRYLRSRGKADYPQEANRAQ